MKLLVVKLGALGDFVQALAAMRKVREAHPGAEITLLTTAPFRALAEASPYVDRVWTDGRPKGWKAHLDLFRRLRREGFARVYDLQTSDRSSGYRWGFFPRFPEWSGIAPGASHPHANPRRDFMHTLERQAEQLKDAGVWPDAPTAPGTAPGPDLSWILNDDRPERRPDAFGLTTPYALLIPGGSAHRPGKRWPVQAYAALAQALRARGLTPAVLGGPAEAELARAIPAAADLTGRTDFAQIAALGARAALAVGNDTGPTHLVAAAGAPTLTLFSHDSDPALCAPRGRRWAVLRRNPLAELSVEEVLEAADTLLGNA